MKLLASQQYEVYQMLLRGGFDPAEFEWREGNGYPAHPGPISVLVHKPSGYYHNFHTDGSGHLMAVMSPGERQLIYSPATWASWEIYVRWITDWLEYLMRETKIPRPWEDLARRVSTGPVLATLTAGNNTLFNPAEVEILRAELNGLKTRVEAIERLTAEQKAKLEEGLEYMRGALTRLGRFDWRNVAATTLITKAAEIGIPAAANLLIRFASHLIGAGDSGVLALPPGDSV